MSENEPKVTETSFSRVDQCFALVMLIVGFLFWNLIRFFDSGAGVTIFAVIAFVLTFAYLAKLGFKQNIVGITCLVLAALSAAQFTLFDNQFIKTLNFAFITGIYIYWISITTGRSIDVKLTAYLLGDLVNQVIIVPFKNFLCCSIGIKGIVRFKNIKGPMQAILGIVVFLPLIVVVIYLLMSADEAFYDFLYNFVKLINFENIVVYISQFIIGIPVAFYLYGLVYGNAKGRNTQAITADSVDKSLKIARIVPRITVHSVLVVFSTIYIIFFAVQAVYLFSAFSGSIPNSLTYANYARRGFFELCYVVGINLGLLVFSHLTFKREKDEESKLLRIETLLISLLTILLIITALSKMVMYINVYGLTQLRVYTSWFMLLLLLIFVSISIRQLKKYNATRIAIIGFIALFMTLSYCNIDGIIAQYNISRYKDGTLKNLDIVLLAELSDAAVPYIYELYMETDHNDIDMRKRLAKAMQRYYFYEDHSFKTFNIQKEKADILRIIVSTASLQVVEPY